MRRRLPSITSLRAFEAVARHLGFSRAADELSLTQCAVSRQFRRARSHDKSEAGRPVAAPAVADRCRARLFRRGARDARTPGRRNAARDGLALGDWHPGRCDHPVARRPMAGAAAASLLRAPPGRHHAADDAQQFVRPARRGLRRGNQYSEQRLARHGDRPAVRHKPLSSSARRSFATATRSAGSRISRRCRSCSTARSRRCGATGSGASARATPRHWKGSSSTRSRSSSRRRC